MAGSTGHIAKAAMFVYVQWEREWVTCMQKNDQKMTYNVWLRAFIQVAERFRYCSSTTTYVNATCNRTDASSMPVGGAKPDSSSHWPSCPAVDSQNNLFMYFLLNLCFFCSNDATEIHRSITTSILDSIVFWTNMLQVRSHPFWMFTISGSWSDDPVDIWSIKDGHLSWSFQSRPAFDF